MDVLALRLLFWLGRPGLRAALGEPDAVRVAAKAPEELPALLGKIPGSCRPAARPFLVVTAWLVAVRRSLPEHTAEQAAVALSGALRSAARLLPRPLRRFYRAVFFSPWYHRRLVHGLLGSGGEAFAGRFLEFPDGFGVEYSACALQHYLRVVGHPELGPEICGLDELESELFELGLRREGTLGRGAQRCDFRWVNSSGGERSDRRL